MKRWSFCAIAAAAFTTFSIPMTGLAAGGSCNGFGGYNGNCGGLGSYGDGSCLAVGNVRGADDCAGQNDCADQRGCGGQNNCGSNGCAEGDIAPFGFSFGSLPFGKNSAGCGFADCAGEIGGAPETNHLTGIILPNYAPGNNGNPGTGLPGQPEAPDQGVKPEKPGDAEKPGQPNKPGDTEKPGQPNKPEKPEQPDQPQKPDENEESGMDSFALEVVELVNAERAKAGLSPLSINTRAASAAAVRANEIQRSFSHTRPDGSSFSTALTQAGANYRKSGENIAYGQAAPQQVMNDWMNSAGHRANILDSAFTSIGVGHVQSSSGVHYWTQLFVN